MSRTISFFAGIFCGAIVGAVAALLLTPESGENLQSRLRDEVTDMWESAQRVSQERRREMEERLQELRSGRAITID
ncbi:MAG TPA: YtxH domain-containing protein [Anaerolineales bacterium]|nr:YtxH domain-containing protein [Anaerolineales bacterium]